MKRLALLPLAVVLALVACTDSQLSPPDSKPQFEIYGRSVEDGFGGYDQEVFFDSPLGMSPSSQTGYDAGAFNAFLRPHVRVCELIGDPTMYPAVPDPVDGPNPNLSCGTDVTPDPATYPYGLPMALDATNEIYKANFKTDNLTDGTFYRIEVFAVPAPTPVDDDFRAAFLLGHRDIAALDGPSVASCGLDAVCNVNIPSNIPIKVRVENFALCPPDVEQCVTKFVDFSAGEELALQGGTRIDIPAQNSAEQSLLTFRTCTPAELQDVMDRTDLPVFGTCLATDTDYEEELTPLALISICDANDIPIDEDRVWDHPQEETITLFHFSDLSEKAVHALPHAAPNCPTFGSEPSNPLIRFAKAVKDRLLSVVTPEPLEANVVLLDRGGGYHTPTMNTKFVMLLPGKFELLNSVDAERVAMVGSTVPAAVKVTDLYGNPIKGARVRFDSPTPDGSITATEVMTDFDKDNPDPSSDGVASVDWTIASNPKLNELFVWGRTIADFTSEAHNGPRDGSSVYGAYDPFLALNTTFDGLMVTEAPVDVPVDPDRTGLTFTVIGCAPGFGTPNLPLDGQLGQDEWQCAQHEQFPVNLSKGSTVMADLYWMNDGSNFYAAVVVPGSDRVNSLRFDWDSDGDAPVGIEGPAEEGDDVWEFDPSSGGLDRYLTAKCTNSSQSSCGADDSSNDVTGAFRNDLGGVTVYELSHPLSTGEAFNGLSIDLDAVAGDMAGFFVTLRLGSGAQGNTQWPGFRVYKKTQIQ